MISTVWALFLASAWVGVKATPVAAPFSLNRRSDGFPYPLDDVDKLEEQLLPKFEAYLANKKNGSSHGCTLQNAKKRYEWHDLSVADREEYIRAVLCLQKKPPKADTKKYPGVLNRYDDFVVTHETQANHLHSTPHLFPAHRLYIWAYEKALRDECGYTGYQPYWNWGRTAFEPAKQPMFNGNMSSMGGNGVKATYPGIMTHGFKKPYDMIPADVGGGCVKDGPFANMTVSLGPIGTVLTDIPKNPSSDGFASNPRCLRRDVNKYAASMLYANYTYNLITKANTIDLFQKNMLGMPDQNDWGVHMSGHYVIGGDPGGDFYSSPGDPLFWFHHGMVDRIWWIWQMQDPEKRMGVLPDNPPKTDVVDLNWIGTKKADTYDLNDSIGGYGGEFCYIYV